ncbi:hypothetical protein [Bdellovibrio sp. BCCA]|uniref:hypothetical protein n=1 Tax=Bdellovibrio sp. BCCA TaxID=3136281 RepID=UPI0030EFF7E9
MSSPESKRLAGMGLPSMENNPILQRQRAFGSKGESSGITFSKPFADSEKPPVEEGYVNSTPPSTQIQAPPQVQSMTNLSQQPTQSVPPSMPQTSVQFTDEQILAMAKERGLALQPVKIKYVKHTYSVTAYNHEMLPKISAATGITIQELMKEGMDHVISKYYASYEYSLKAPTPKKRN